MLAGFKFMNNRKFIKGQVPWNKGSKGVMIAWNKGLKNYNIGKKNGNWKGDKLTYSGIHMWLVRIFGKANKCEFCDLVGCKKNNKWNIEWAKLKDKKYERKRENFIMLCKLCHNRYDKTGFKQGYTSWNTGMKGYTNLGSFKKQVNNSFTTTQ